MKGKGYMQDSMNVHVLGVVLWGACKPNAADELVHSPVDSFLRYHIDKKHA